MASSTSSIKSLPKEAKKRFRRSRRGKHPWIPWLFPSRARSKRFPISRYENRMSRLIVGAHPAERLVRTLAAVIEIRGFQARERVGRQRVAFGFDVDIVNLRRIKPEDLLFIFLGDLLIPDLLTHLVRDLEALEGVDHPLRRAPPEAVRSPDHVIHPIRLHVLAHPVHCHHGLAHPHP